MYKKIRMHLLTLLLFTPALHGVEFERETVKSMDGSSMLCFKQPATMDDKQFLVHLLKKTEQKRKIHRIDLQVSAHTIAQLCTKNKGLLNTPITDDLKYTPIQYASKNCHTLIDGVLIKLMGEDKNYTPRSEQVKQLSKENVQKISAQLIEAINNTLPPLKFMAGKELEKIIGGPLETMDPQNSYHWAIRYIKDSKNEMHFSLVIYKKADLDVFCEITCEITKGRIEKKIRCYISSLKVNSDYRQHGYGKALLKTIEGLATSLKKNTTLSLFASPIDEKMRYILIKYYKDFGFTARDKKSSYMKLYIDKTGNRIKTDKIRTYLKGIHNKSLKKYVDGAKGFAKKIAGFIKDHEQNDKTKCEKLEFAIQRAKKISMTMQKCSKINFSLTIFLDEYKYTKVNFSVADAKITYLSEENTRTDDKIIRFLSAKILFELQKKIADLDNSVPVPANMPKDWCTLWGQSIEEDATK